MSCRICSACLTVGRGFDFRYLWIDHRCGLTLYFKFAKLVVIRTSRVSMSSSFQSECSAPSQRVYNAALLVSLLFLEIAVAGSDVQILLEGNLVA